MQRKTIAFLILLVFQIASAEEYESVIQLQLDHPARTEKEIARDINRRPAETLAFFGLKPDMRVIELFPGGGWYTKLIGPYVAESGKLYVAMGTNQIESKLDEFGLTAVEPIGKVFGFEKTDGFGWIYQLSSLDLEHTDIDMVLTFRNVHNLTSEARMVLNRAVFKALKPGGVYGIIDHTKRHMQGLEKWTWRRADPVEIIKEAIDAGFELVDYSTIHARPEDELKYDTRHDSLVNETDRFTLKFKKPN